MKIFGVLVLVALFWLRPATGQVQLTSSAAETNVCPREMVTFRCTVTNGAHLRWIADPEIPAVNPITYLPEHSAGRVVYRGNLSANLTFVQRNPMNILAANMTSTLIFRVVNNIEVFCENKSLLLIVPGPPAAPTIVSGVQSLTCDTHQRSQVVNVSWAFDANCTNCTVLSMTAGYTSHQLLCSGETTIAVELNCSDIYIISFTAINQCGQQSDQTAVEVTLSRTGITTTLPTESDTRPTDITNGTETPPLTPGETNPYPLGAVIGVVIGLIGVFLIVAVVVIAISILLVRKSKKKPSLGDRSQKDEEKDG